jgi:arylsulfatase A-like enzyme
VTWPEYETGLEDRQELLNTVFAIHAPGQTRGKQISSLVSTLDIFPTVLKMVGIDNPVLQQTKGIDLTPSFSGHDVSRTIFSETDYRLYTHKRSLKTPDGWKFIVTLNGPERELYNLKTDPYEKNNLAVANPRKAYELEQLIYDHLKAMGVDPTGPWPLGCLPVYGDQCQEVSAGPASRVK